MINTEKKKIWVNFMKEIIKNRMLLPNTEELLPILYIANILLDKSKSA